MLEIQNELKTAILLQDSLLATLLQTLTLLDYFGELMQLLLQKTLNLLTLGQLLNRIGLSRWCYIIFNIRHKHDVLRGYDQFADVDNIEIDFLIAPESVSNRLDATAVVNDLVATAEVRKDCVAVASPSRRCS